MTPKREARGTDWRRKRGSGFVSGQVRKRKRITLAWPRHRPHQSIFESSRSRPKKISPPLQSHQCRMGRVPISLLVYGHESASGALRTNSQDETRWAHGRRAGGEQSHPPCADSEAPHVGQWEQANRSTRFRGKTSERGRLFRPASASLSHRYKASSTPTCCSSAQASIQYSVHLSARS
ncbi:hypothetical protein GUJ93_ZPchr0004g38525 [Zizania palustris]|uniref:Uncharacterized protein n=1 Tax=Zizania palustris TaxID=103762 RepID=A0A8J5VZL4_ZIZPA|nr:hypothetical protein GUJ93_ZPchr0004g38525 [Zizania palustris]